MATALSSLIDDQMDWQFGLTSDAPECHGSGCIQFIATATICL
jgi:hypothetical protein